MRTTRTGWTHSASTHDIEALRIAYRAAIRAGINDPAVRITGRTAATISLQWHGEVRP